MKKHIEKEKIIRLIEFLTSVASLRTKVIRDVKDYQRVIWFKDISQQKGCFCRLWENEEDDPDIWLEIKHQQEPELPKVPDICKDWFDEKVLRNKKELPELLPQITKQIKNPNWQDGSDQPEFISRIEYLKDHPEVQSTWNKYLENSWLPWVETHDRWERVHRIYTALFSIWKEQQRRGEEYELVLGLGLLTWQTPSGQQIRRHLIVANAMLEFEASSEKFTVRSHPDGANVRIESDMLAEEYPIGVREIEELKKKLEDSNDPWNNNIIEETLKALVHSIQPDGEYRDTPEPKAECTTTKPIVEYAPALILRKRSVKGFDQALRRIKEKVEGGEQIPLGFADLAEVSEERDTGSNVGKLDTVFDGEIYFPKPSNEEQRQIVKKLSKTDGVLVQGPPGTGKSHTIANLICHLLAKGQRILVTAKTPRALRVLKKLLPEEIQPLCIHLLGEGVKEKQSLEESVSGILQKQEEWNENWAKGELKKLENELYKLRKEAAEIERRLLSIREAETQSHTIGPYKGTAAYIAQAINKDQEKFRWFTDIVPLEQECPVSEVELREVINFLRKITPEKRQELRLILPRNLPAPEEFSDLVEKEKKIIKEEKSLCIKADEQIVKSLLEIEDNNIQKMINYLSDFQTQCKQLLSLPYPWIQNAIKDTLAGHIGLWDTLYKITTDTISFLKERVNIADEITLDIPENIDLRVLLNDARQIKEHLEKGGKLRRCIFFWHEIVKDKTYILKKIHVDGLPCCNIEQFQKLVETLEVRVELEKVWEYWKDQFKKTQGPYTLQLQVLKNLCISLQGVFSLRDKMRTCQSILSKCSYLPDPEWTNETYIKKLIAYCRLALIRREKMHIENRIRKILALLEVREPNAHPVIRDLRDAVQKRDVNAFATIFSKIENLNREKKTVQRMNERLKKLREIIPNLIEDLIQTKDEAYWEERISQIQNAWFWAQAKRWLNEHIKKEDLPALSERRQQIDNEINSLVAKIASLRAWSFCFSRLKEEHRRHMIAWQQAMRRLGKGTGKYAFRNRREAQKHLNKCREAVPAWVMPLHRVWDTVDPSPGMFDVVIVDEASQCGLEALPLLYLGKKMLIVGDDKQISPEAVGLPRDAFHRLMEEFLYDFRFKDSFDVENSIFDHAKLRYGVYHVTLREHFRCMPEIIRFSNELCYGDTPLIPLRQYGSERLSPLKRFYVQNGYREGYGNRVINRPEAEVIVEKIVELCKDARYRDKSMGVIVLQGEAQAQLIEKMLLEKLGAEEMEKRGLICGNPYSFQGDERDIIFLSMVAAPNERIGVLSDKMANRRRFNVAVSRARDQIWLFHSVIKDELSPSCLRRRLLEFFENTYPKQIAGLKKDELEPKAFRVNRSLVKPPQPFESWFEVDVALDLLRRGFTVTPQYEVAGKRIDLVVEGGNARLAVECDGDKFHGPEQYEQDMHRQRILERCGWVFFRIRASEYYADKRTALEGLWKLLEERRIYPNTFSTNTRKPEKKQRIDKEIDVGDVVEYVYLDDPENNRQVQITTGSSNSEWGTVNVKTPIAQALLGAKEGDTVEAILPVGPKKLRILKVIKEKQKQLSSG